MFKGKIIRFFVAFLALVLLLPCVTAFAQAPIDRNYSDPLASAKVELSAGEFLEQHFGFTLSEAEKVYLGLYGDFKLSYNAVIPSGYVTIKYDPDEKTLDIDAKEYSYLASNGIEVIWQPYSAVIEGSGEYLFAGETSLSLDVSAALGEEVKVKYQAEFTVEKDITNLLLNMAYDDAVRLKAEVERETAAYEAARLEFESDTAKYNEYIAKLALYKEYLVAKRIYDEEYAAYVEYIEDLREYTAAKAEYDAYVIERDKYNEEYAIYSEYLVYMEQYPSKLAAYEQYLKNVELVKAQLSIIDQTKDSITSLNRSIYAAIMGNTVTEVIANKADLASKPINADPVAIDRAGVATENLRVLLSTYFSLATEKEKYTYYVTNYEGFRDNFAELLRCLDKLYLNKMVRALMEYKERHEQFVILVSQLYYVTLALSDTPVLNYDGNAYFDSSYMVGKSTSYYKDARKPADVLKTPGYMQDANSAAPISGGYPSPVEKPVYITMDEPIKPVEVKEPIPPAREILEPEAPTPVDEPEVAKEPGKEPIPYVVSPEVSALIAAYDAGLVTEKSEVSADVSFAPTISITRNFVSPREVTVRFYGSECVDEAEKLLYEITVDSGSAIDYRGPTPVKKEEKAYTYRHIGWVDGDGVKQDISAVRSDLELYADFERVEKPYTVTWIVGDSKYTSCPEYPTLPDNGIYFYVFRNWEKTYRIDPVTGEETLDVIWISHFDRFEYASSPGILDLTVDEDKYTLSVKNSSYVNFATLISKIAGQGELAVKTDKGTVSFSFGETLALNKAGVAALEVHAMQQLYGEYVYSVSLYDSNGAPSEHIAKINFASLCNARTPSHLVLFYEEAGERRLVKYTYDSTSRRITFAATTDNVYRAKVEYALSVVSTSDVKVSTDKTVALEGESIKLSIDVLPGIDVRGIYAVDSDGNRVEIDPDDFKMLPYDTTVIVDYVIVEYTVTFVSDGKIIASFICRYGDTVTPPPDPNKAADNKYYYKFVGWSADIVPVTESVTYTALYTYRLIDKKPDASANTPNVLNKIVLLASLGFTLVTIVIPSAAMCPMLFYKRKKLFIERKNESFDE